MSYCDSSQKMDVPNWLNNTPPQTARRAPKSMDRPFLEDRREPALATDQSPLAHLLPATNSSVPFDTPTTLQEMLYISSKTHPNQQQQQQQQPKTLPHAANVEVTWGAPKSRRAPQVDSVISQARKPISAHLAHIPRSAGVFEPEIYHRSQESDQLDDMPYSKQQNAWHDAKGLYHDLTTKFGDIWTARLQGAVVALIIAAILLRLTRRN